MKQKILYLMCGIPGSGKSHWAKGVKDAVIVSRDAIRFNLLKDGEDYFAHEDEVVETFIYDLNGVLLANGHVKYMKFAPEVIAANADVHEEMPYLIADDVADIEYPF